MTTFDPATAKKLVAEHATITTSIRRDDHRISARATVTNPDADMTEEDAYLGTLSYYAGGGFQPDDVRYEGCANMMGLYQRLGEEPNQVAYDALFELLESACEEASADYEFAREEMASIGHEFT